MKYIIDIREEHELLEKKYISKNNNLIIIAIPSRIIFANTQFLENLSKNNQILISCKTGRRANLIKNKYFSNNKNIITINNINNFLNDIIIIKNNKLSLMQYMQIIFSIIILITIILSYNNYKYIIIYLIIIFLFIIIQVITKSCLLSKIIPYN